MLNTIIAVVTGIALLMFIVYIDFRIVSWIVAGGLKTFRQKLLLIYLPIALWGVCGCVIYIYPPLAVFYGSGEMVSFPWLQRFFMLLNSIYGIGVTLYIFDNYSKADYRHWFLSVSMMLMLVFPVIKTVGLRFNLTPSMPRGIYVMQPAAEKPERGDMVSFCLEPNNPFTEVAKERDYIGSGTCPSGLKPFLKTLAGLPGDKVEMSPDGIILNGSYLAGTSRPNYDSQGRLVPPSLLVDGLIPDGQALVISQQHSGSFDSRHFGLVPYESLTKVEPVFTESVTPEEGGLK